MDGYQIIAIVIVLTTLLNTLNRRVLHLPPTIGMMLAGLLVSVGVVVVGRWIPDLPDHARAWVTSLDFNDLVLKGILGFLLFAGARKINLGRLMSRLWPISIFALGGVIFSAFIIAGALAWLSQWLGLGLSFLECLLFGAIISPTDPIAVLAILRQVGAPKNLEMDIEGESLFNDGIGVVMFIVVTQVMVSPGDVSVGTVLGLFGLEAAGGVALGFAFGFIASRMIRSNQDPRTQLLLTLCIATGGYQLADMLHASGPLAMVVSGIIVGNHEDWVEPICRAHLDSFWDLIDEVGNAVLFMLVGLELLLVGHEALPEWRTCVLAGGLAVPLVLGARWLALVGPMAAMKCKHAFDPGALTIMTWGGLRGGLPLAMALCIATPAVQMASEHIPRSQTVDRAMLLMMTYTVVVFSILVQGLTIKPLLRRYSKRSGAA
jgi:monovalent cation:H+ antiporter, CPA1 family